MTRSTLGQAFFLLIFGLIIFTSIWSTTPPKPEQEPEKISGSAYGTERYWQDHIHEFTEGEKEYRLDDGTRVDLLFDGWACEIDWENKWAEGVGQSIYYSRKTKHKPLVILLAKTDKWTQYRDRVEYCGIDCWVFDTRSQTWRDRE